MSLHIRTIRTIVLLLSFLSLSVFALQSPTEAQLRQAQQAAGTDNVDLSQFIQSNGNSTGRGRQVNIPGQNNSLINGENSILKPYGANLFQGGFESERSDGLNSAYLVAPGDKISIQMWGTVNRSEVLTVDNQGNIFIADVGPVKVKDVPADRINSMVTQSIKSIYTNNVSVYVNLLTSTPVSVFVTGSVLRPGQYAGLASDSVLFYLKRAGGIDAIRGSYRNIAILRNSKIITTYDLYDFLKEGVLAGFSFKDQDVILVQDQGTAVTVEGAARFPFRFELIPGETLGQNLTNFARPLEKASHVAVTGNRESGPLFIYLPLSKFDTFEIMDGDTILFNEDLRQQAISVQISGSYSGPSFYTVNKNTRLLDLLNHIEVDPEQANYGAIYLKRESVAEQQQLLLNESLNRLERSIYTAPARSNGEASIRSSEARLVSQFVARARLIEPLGKVIVSEDGNVANIRLEQGDEIIIPAYSDLIQVSGEVLVPQAIVYNENATVSDYVAWAGGFSERANDDQIVIVRANGVTEFVEAQAIWFAANRGQTLQPGDQILVLPKVDAKLMQSVKDITQIIFQIAVAANAIN